MTSKDFVAGLAEIMGVEKTELATVDRALAKEGLRQIARGRHRPDITLQEGLQIVLAWAAAKNFTMAAEEVERLRCFQVPYAENGRPRYAQSGKDTEEFRAIYETSQDRLGGLDIFEVLGKAARAIAAGDFPGEKYWVNVQRDGEIELVHTEGFLQKRTLVFDYLGKFIPDGPRGLFEKKRPTVKYSVAVSGTVLKWIYDVTEGAV